MSAFKVVNYIKRRMKACGVKRGDRSSDTPARLLDMALTALNSQGKLEKAKPMEHTNRELIFKRYGDVWAASLEYKELLKNE